MAHGDFGPLTLGVIKHFEGYTPKPKWDNKQYSVGYSTRWEPGAPVGTREEHEAALSQEVGKVNGWLDNNVRVPMTDEQRAALNSFGYNLGNGALDKLKDDINRGDWDRVGERMLTFSRAGDDPDALLPRRKDEVALLLQGRNPTASETASAPQEDKVGLFTMLGQQLGAGFGGGQGEGVPSLASGADPDALNNLWGTLASAGGGGKQAKPASDTDGAELAMAAASKDEDTMRPMVARPFDMQQLATMLKNSGYLGTSQPRRVA